MRINLPFFGFAVFVLLVSFGCSSEKAPQSSPRLAGEAPYAQANFTAETETSSGIAKEELHPLRKYTNFDHVVLVLKVSNGIEYGKYLVPFTSSFGMDLAYKGGIIIDPGPDAFAHDRTGAGYMMFDYHKPVVSK